MEKVYLVITIDCECDKSDDWTSSCPITFTSITEGLPNILHPLFNKYGAIPTYLLSNEVMEDKAAVETLKALEGCYEYGTHLHADYVGPNKRYDEYSGTMTEDFQKDYPPEIEEAKLKNLTRLFEQKIGYSPKSFRAGKFGISEHTISILERLGYLVDTSVTPYLLWWNNVSLVDFLKASNLPYYPVSQGIGHKVLEVPITIETNFLNKALYKKVFPFLIQPSVYRFSFRVINKLLPCRWLRPFPHYSSQEMIDISEKVIRKNKGRMVVLNMMFHSTEVMPGKSPYIKSQDDQANFLDRIEGYFKYCRDRRINFSNLTEIGEVFKSLSGH